MRKITPDDTATLFIGSGALSYPWYRVDDMHGVNLGLDVASADDWHVLLVHCDPDADIPIAEVRVDHRAIMRAIRKIVKGSTDIHPDSETGRACRVLLSRGADEADYDAITADSVIQIAAFGKVIYG